MPLCVTTALFTVISCDLDTYDSPDATVYGSVLDNEGNPLQVEQGASSMVIRLLENGFENPEPFDLNMKQDGTYTNSKVFAATYMAYPYGGPFYPMEPVQLNVSGTVKQDFEVTPYLKVEWVAAPVALEDGRIQASFKFHRNDPPAGSDEQKPNLLDYQLFIAHTQYVGNNNYDNLVVGKAFSVSNDKEDAEITIVSKTPMKFSRQYYVRVGVRVKDSNKKYNYTTIEAVQVTLP